MDDAVETARVSASFVFHISNILMGRRQLEVQQQQQTGQRGMDVPEGRIRANGAGGTAAHQGGHSAIKSEQMMGQISNVQRTCTIASLVHGGWVRSKSANRLTNWMHGTSSASEYSVTWNDLNVSEHVEDGVRSVEQYLAQELRIHFCSRLQGVPPCTRGKLRVGEFERLPIYSDW
jgi:hypothetical protein